MCNILKGLDFSDFFLESSLTLTKEDKDIRRKEYDILCEHESDVLCEHVSDVLCEQYLMFCVSTYLTCCVSIHLFGWGLFQNTSLLKC